MVKDLVVLIDNDQPYLEFLESIINNVDSSVQCVSFIYGDEALELLCNEFRHTPKAIIINANLKRTSGARLLKALRSSPSFDDCIVCIFMSTLPVAVADIYTSLGADFAFERPGSREQAESILGKILLSPRKVAPVHGI